MSKQQIIDKEKEGMPIDAMLDNGLSFRYTSNAKSLYTSLDATYIFSDGKNGLEAIFLVYNDASLKLFHNIKDLHSSECGKPINRNNRFYWRSKDKSYVVELSDQRDKQCVYETIAKTDWMVVKDINFSKKLKEQSDLPEWQTVQTFSGSSMQTTDDFTIKAKKWRVVWSVVPLDSETPSLFFGVQVDGENRSEFFGNVYHEDKGTSVFRSKGSFYFKITASNANWSIDVQEYSSQ
jgi:hypothetical protein